MWRPGILLLLVCLSVACSLQAVVAQDDSCDPNDKPPIFILPGISGSELRGVYSDDNPNPVYSDRTVKKRSRTSTTAKPTASDATVGTPLTNNATLDADQKRLLKKVARAVAEYARKQQKEGKGADPAGWWDGDPCPNANSADKLNVWLPLETKYLLYPKCFYHLLTLRYDADQDRFSNASNSAVAADLGGSSGTDYSLFNYAGYDDLTAYIAKTFRYTIGKNLFAAPYDWRYDLVTMDQVWQMNKLANRIEAAVAANCGKKAILIGHSMGTLVSLGLLQNPALQSWREANIQGYIALAPPYGGAVPAVNARVAGGGLLTLDGILGKLLGPTMREILYYGTFGMPAPVMLMPYDTAFASDSVVLKTPARTYTVSQLDELMEAIGDKSAARFFKKVRDLKPLLAKGDVPGVPTYCIYGTGVDTPKTYSIKRNIKPDVKSDLPAVALMGKGDGTVNLESLQLCRELTTEANITELADGVTHMTVLTDPIAQAALGRYLRQMLEDD